jgi:hypothetical protein
MLYCLKSTLPPLPCFKNLSDMQVIKLSIDYTVQRQEERQDERAIRNKY